MEPGRRCGDLQRVGAPPHGTDRGRRDSGGQAEEQLGGGRGVCGGHLRLLAESQEAEHAVRLASVLKPDALLMNLAMSGQGNADIVRNVMARAPTRIIAYALQGSSIGDLQLDAAREHGVMLARRLDANQDAELVAALAEHCQTPKPPERGTAAPPSGPLPGRP